MDKAIRLRPGEASTYLGVSDGYLSMLVKRGEIKNYRVGNRSEYDIEDLNTWMCNRRRRRNLPNCGRLTTRESLQKRLKQIKKENEHVSVSSPRQ